MDIMEMIDGGGTAGDGAVYSTYHWQTTYPARKCAYPAGHEHVYASQRLAVGWNETMHEFAVERGQGHVAFALDGHVLLNASNASFFDVPWYLILNTAIGGGWPGPVTPRTAFPISHQIDYVRVARLVEREHR